VFRLVLLCVGSLVTVASVLGLWRSLHMRR